MNGYQLLNEVSTGGTLSSLFTILSLFTENVKMSWQDDEVLDDDVSQSAQSTRTSVRSRATIRNRLDDQILTSHTLTWILYLKKLEALHLALVVVVLLCLLQVQQYTPLILCLPLLVLLLLDHLLIVLDLGDGTLVDLINPDNMALLLVLSRTVP